MIVSSATGYAQVIVAMVVAGTGMGFNYPNLVGWLIESTDPVVRGRVVGGVATFAFTGQFCSPIIARPFIERAGLGFAFEVAATAVLCGAGLFASTALYRRIKRR